MSTLLCVGFLLALKVQTPSAGVLYSGGYGYPINRPHQAYRDEMGPTEGVGKVVQADGGFTHTVALRADGTVVTWGSNEERQLGQGDLPSPVPGTMVVVPGLPKCVAVAAGPTFCLALSAAGEVYGWGSNAGWQLGPAVGTRNSKYATKIVGLSNIQSISAGNATGYALRSDGTVWAWGNNSYGTLGDGTKVSRQQPALVVGLSNIIQIDGAGLRAFALKSDGTVYGWGENGFGRLGAGSTLPQVTSPVQLPALSLIKRISGANDHALALRDDGLVYSWGQNDAKQLGDPGAPATYQGRSLPAIVPGLSDISEIAAGPGSNLVVDVDQNLWAFGRTNGVLGSFSIAYPTRVPNVEKVVSIASGEYHHLAVSQTATPVWCQTVPGQVVGGHENSALRIVVEGGTAVDLPISLASSTSAAQLASSAVIPAGQSEVTVPVTCPSLVGTYQTAVLTAAVGATRGAASLGLSPERLDLRLPLGEVDAGDSAALTIALNFAAPAGGVKVGLWTDRPDALPIPASAHIPEGQKHVTLSVKTTPSASYRVSEIKAQAGPLSATAVLGIRGNLLSSVEFVPAILVGTRTATLRVVVARPAPEGGTRVDLLNPNHQITAPDYCFVPAGKKTVSVLVRTRAVTTEVTLPLTAVVSGFRPKVANLTLRPPTLTEFTVLPQRVEGGGVLNVRIALDAVSAGDIVGFTCTDPAVQMPSSGTVEAGFRTLKFTVTTLPVSESVYASIKARLRGVVVSTWVLVTVPPPPLASVSLTPSVVKGGTTVWGTVTLASRAAKGGVLVDLKSALPNVASVPPTVFVANGSTSARFAITTAAVDQPVKLSITASLKGVVKKAALTVNP
jgi:alpha-tubulin suppressor-like RCC1 family protein